MSDVRIRPAREVDVPVVLRLITALGEYEKLAHEVVATEADIHDGLFGPRATVEVVIRAPQPPPPTPQLCQGTDYGFATDIRLHATASQRIAPWSGH